MEDTRETIAIHRALNTVRKLKRDNMAEIEDEDMRSLMLELLDLQDYKEGVESAITVAPHINQGDLLLHQLENDLNITQGQIMGKERELITYLNDFFLKNPFRDSVLSKTSSKKLQMTWRKEEC